jgi:hypothetical protein
MSGVRQQIGIGMPEMPEPLMGGDQGPHLVPAAPEIGRGSDHLLAEAKELGGDVELPFVTGAMHRDEDDVMQAPAAVDHETHVTFRLKSWTALKMHPGRSEQAGRVPMLRTADADDAWRRRPLRMAGWPRQAAFALRRLAQPRPSRPMPKRAREAGSGTVVPVWKDWPIWLICARPRTVAETLMSFVTYRVV